MGMLEQLLGSRSVGSAVATQLQLHAFNLLGISLLIVWAFSPLGSQAILRVLSSSLEPRVSTSTIVNYDNLHAVGMPTQSVMTGGDQYPARAFNQYIKTIFGALIVSPVSTKIGSMDQWGNVKIPFLPIKDDNTNVSSEWKDVTYDTSLERFSSIAGLPVANVPFGNTTFSIESSYVELDCYNASRVPWAAEWLNYMGQDIDFNFDKPLPNGTLQGIHSYDFDIDNWLIGSWTIALNNFVDDYWTELSREGWYTNKGPASLIQEDGIQVNPTELFFWSRVANGESDSPENIIASCKVRQRYVESRVTCERTQVTSPNRNCTVVAQRPSQKPHTTEMISDLNFFNVWAYITHYFPTASSDFQSERMDIAVQYLNDPKMVNYEANDSDDWFKDINQLAFSRRLSQLLNTYLLLSRVYTSAPGGSLDGSQLDHNITLEAPTTTLVEIYTVSTLWISLGSLSCAVLLVGGILSVVSRLMAAGPEVLGYASSVIRDSKHVGLPAGVDKMNSLEITRLFKDKRVRYGYTDLSQDGQRVVGVGLQSETVDIKSRTRKGDQLL